MINLTTIRIRKARPNHVKALGLDASKTLVEVLGHGELVAIAEVTANGKVATWAHETEVSRKVGRGPLTKLIEASASLMTAAREAADASPTAAAA